MSVRFIIRAVRSAERDEFIDYLQRKLPQAEWCFDTNRQAFDTFQRALAMAGSGPAVHMEEDIILTRDFTRKIEHAISERPGEVIQFFSLRKSDLVEGSRYDRNYMMNQCVYFPAGYSAYLLSYCAGWRMAHPEHPTGFDITIADWLKSRREKYWLHVPSLVQHRIAKSAIDSRRSSRRQSPSFQNPDIP